MHTNSLRKTQTFSNTATFLYTTTKNACSMCSANHRQEIVPLHPILFYTLHPPALEKRFRQSDLSRITASFSFARPDTSEWLWRNLRYLRTNVLHSRLGATPPPTFVSIILRPPPIKLINVQAESAKSTTVSAPRSNSSFATQNRIWLQCTICCRSTIKTASSHTGMNQLLVWIVPHIPSTKLFIAIGRKTKSPIWFCRQPHCQKRKCWCQWLWISEQNSRMWFSQRLRATISTNRFRYWTNLDSPFVHTTCLTIIISCNSALNTAMTIKLCYDILIWRRLYNLSSIWKPPDLFRNSICQRITLKMTSAKSRWTVSRYIIWN